MQNANKAERCSECLVTVRAYLVSTTPTYNSRCWQSRSPDDLMFISMSVYGSVSGFGEGCDQVFDEHVFHFPQVKAVPLTTFRD